MDFKRRKLFKVVSTPWVEKDPWRKFFRLHINNISKEKITMTPKVQKLIAKRDKIDAGIKAATSKLIGLKSQLSAINKEIKSESKKK